MKRFHIPAFTLLATTAILVVFHASGGNGTAFSSSDTDLQHRLVGSWKAVSFADVPDHGETVYPFGKSPSGLMIYTANGYFSISVMAGPNSIVPKDISAMSVEDWRGLAQQFLSWFGTYRTSDSQTIVLHVNGSSWPAYNGTDQVRKCRVEGDNLVFYGDYTKNDHYYHYEHVFRRLNEQPR